MYKYPHENVGQYLSGDGHVSVYCAVVQRLRQ